MTDVLERADREHRELLTLARAVETAPRPAERGRLFARFKDELLLHTVVEEATLHAELDLLGDDDLSRAVRATLHDHDEMERTLCGLGSWSAGGLPFSPRFGAAVDLLVDHVVRHEALLARAARARLRSADLKELGREMGRLRASFDGAPPAARADLSETPVTAAYDEARAAARRGSTDLAVQLLLAAVRPGLRHAAGAPAPV